MLCNIIIIISKCHVFLCTQNNLNEDQWKEAEIAATNAKVKWVWLEISDKSRWRSETNKLLDEKFKENKVVQAIESSHLQNRKMKNQ